MINPTEKEFTLSMSRSCPEFVNIESRLDMLYNRLNLELRSTRDTLSSPDIDNAAIAQITTGIITEQVRQYQPRQERSEWRLIHPIWYGQETCGYIYFEESDERQHIEIECVPVKQLLNPDPESLSDPYQLKLFIDREKTDLNIRLNGKALEPDSVSDDELNGLCGIFAVIETADYAPFLQE